MKLFDSKQQLRFETLLAELSARFINIAADKVDELIVDAQMQVCKHLNLDLSALWQNSADNPGAFFLTHYYIPPCFPPVPKHMNAEETFPWCLKKILKGESVVLSRVADTPPSAELDRESFRRFNIKSAVVLPLSVGGGKAFGALTFNTTRNELNWPVQLESRMQLVAQIFANALARRSADMALRQKNDRYRAIFEGAIEGMYQTTPQGKSIVVNPSLAKMLGYDSGEEAVSIIEDTASQVWADPEERDRFLRLLEDKGTIRGYECRFKRKDGTIALVSLNSSVVRGADGQAVYYQGFIENITERKRSEDAIRESEGRYQALFETAPAGIILIGTDGYVQAANPEQARLYRYETPQELIGLYAPTFVAEKDRELAARNMQALLLGEKLAKRSYTSVRRDGSEFISEVISEILRGIEGEVKGYLCITQDITERKNMEAKIKLDAEEWRATFNSIPDPIMILDDFYRVVRVNTAAKSLIGFSEDKTIGFNFFELTHWKEESIKKLFNNKIKHNRHEDEEFYDEMRYKWFRVSAEPVFNEQGDVKQIILVVRDITEQKKADAEAVAAHREMLKAERLFQMGELMASLAHELNQPLMAILSNAKAALRFMQNDRLDMVELKEILEDIASDDKRAGDIIRSLRSMVKPQEGAKEIIALNVVAREAISLFKSEAIIRNIKIETDFDDSMPPVEIDKIQIQQVILNLMMNAADSMTGAVQNRKIIIQTKKADNNKVLFAMRDFGTGIAKDNSTKIFESFYTTKSLGLGMGLSLSRNIIESHGGRIWFENNSDDGATFLFDLPFADEK